MRVLAGELKGQRLITPKGRTTRPTADQVRIACLDTLMPYLEAGPFLDLFAGAGGVGIEGLSRGAPSAVFVEEDRAAFAALADNVKRLGLGERARIIRADLPDRFRKAAQHLPAFMLLPNLRLVERETQLLSNRSWEVRQPIERIDKPNQLARLFWPLSHYIYYMPKLA